ncbi:MAG: two-component system response regulator [Methylophaga sp.]|nr:MAG: two-component system response regulator [Methylophaga sp.]
MENIKQQILAANVLIVDDQALNIKLLEKILKQAGYQNIFSTTDPRQVTDMYVELDADVLLLDIRMPHLDGFQVMEQLQTVVGDDYLPILVLTAELTTETRSKALGGGAKDFLTKPFEQQEVLQRINNIIEVRLLYKQVRQQNKRLEIEVKKRTHELEESRLEIIQRLGKAAEYKDNETGNHVIRVSMYAKLLAKAIGLSEIDVDLIFNAIPMHDIGKIAIPDHILLKPGKLDPAEWEIMKTHVNLGAELLSGGHSPLVIMAKNIALTHHEKWDGTGYPNGLVGENIPMEGRVCAICDVFDALLSERPYKKAWLIEDTMAFLHQEKGKHFEPLLVDKFVQILPEVMNFRADHLDTEES